MGNPWLGTKNPLIACRRGDFLIKQKVFIECLPYVSSQIYPWPCCIVYL